MAGFHIHHYGFQHLECDDKAAAASAADLLLPPFLPSLPSNFITSPLPPTYLRQ